MPWSNSLLLVGTLGLGLLSLWYSLVPVYEWAPRQPFTGHSWYNPFARAPLVWARANFHIHTRTWGGLTEGYQEAPAIQRVYKRLGYAWIGLSDYQRVNPASPLPLYEHGWNLGKIHQLCFWPSQVVWWDFPFGQTLAMRQFVLERLRPVTGFLVLAHPRFMRSYTGPHLAQLGGYEAIEVLNRFGDSVAEWDSALSSGHFAPILAHDNVHDVENPHQLMSRWTEVLLPEKAPVESLRAALFEGRTVGYRNRTPFPIQGPYPRLQQVEIVGETLLRIKLTLVADSLRLIGQGGEVRQVVYRTDSLTYAIRPNDTYLRLEAYTAQVELYASPLVRGGPKRRGIPPRRPFPSVQGLIAWLFGAFWLLVSLRLWQKRQTKAG